MDAGLTADADTDGLAGTAGEVRDTPLAGLLQELAVDDVTMVPLHAAGSVAAALAAAAATVAAEAAEEAGAYTRPLFCST
jgi:hypothetical protein